MSRFDLLEEPIFTVRLARGAAWKASLAQILERLGRRENLEFPALRSYQQHPWYAFLAQLASSALCRSREEFKPSSAQQWKSWLLHLTDGATEPFCLIVEDLAQPAFLQPPVPEGCLDAFNKEALRPDELDVLVTAKNHDVKASRMEHPDAEHWIFSLVTLQTMEGFLGAGNYGISRMNGGFASRPFVSYACDPGWGARFCRDVPLILSSREELIDSYGYRAENGESLLWLEPWDGKTSFELQECDPFFIEICRRVRFRMRNERISALSRPTAAPRIAQRNRRGNTGDPWTPVERGEEPKALNLTASGWNYGLVRRLILSNDFCSGVTQRFHTGEPRTMYFTASALARKQGGTEGLHERVIPIPGKVSGLLATRSGRERVEKMAKERVEDAAKWSREVLRWALCALAQGRPKDLDFSDQRVRPVLRDLDTRIDRIFFAQLWEDSALSKDEAAMKWNRKLRELARDELERASHSMGLSPESAYRNRACASMVFGHRVGKTFPDLFAE
jgi:CRISPR system Cascade subunit CasA